MTETKSAVRARYEIARSNLDAMKTSITSAEFSAALLGFLTFGRSLFDVARAETARQGMREPTRHRVDAAEGEPLVAFFIGGRNAALKENRYAPMRAIVTAESATTIRLSVMSHDELISPSRGIDQSKPPQTEATLEIEARKGESPSDGGSLKQEYYFTSAPYSGQSVIALSEQFLARLETMVIQVEQSIATNTSSGSVR